MSTGFSFEGEWVLTVVNGPLAQQDYPHYACLLMYRDAHWAKKFKLARYGTLHEEIGGTDMSARQNEAELETQFREQAILLASSCKAFDQGTHEEYKRMSGHLRILLHDSARQTSLLTLLQYKNIPFFDTARDIDPANLLPQSTLTMIKVVVGGPSAYEAPLDMPRPRIVPNRQLSFDSWWNKIVFKFQTYTLSRRDLVLIVAEKDGGVHVDVDLTTPYYALSRLNALRWTSNANGIDMFIPIDGKNSPPPPVGYASLGEIIGPVSASMRQISHETLKSMGVKFPQLLAGVYG
jgi:hypothetical protein